MKAHILVVEDEALLYERLRKHLVKEYYSIDEYSPSVTEAIARINLKRPDLVLLDINLKGEATGLDLGKILSETYHIPFIYVTDFDDDQTFYRGLETNHEHFVVKTKPSLDVKQLIRTIQTVLNKCKNPNSPLLKDAILAYEKYIVHTKEFSNNKVSQVPVKFKDIAFFTTNAIPENNKPGMVEKLKRNYARIQTVKGASYYIPQNLKPILKVLPYNFIRINDAYIVNIDPEVLNGRINGKRIKTGKEILTISDTYRAEVEKRFEILYQKMK